MNALLTWPNRDITMLLRRVVLVRIDVDSEESSESLSSAEASLVASNIISSCTRFSVASSMSLNI